MRYSLRIISYIYIYSIKQTIEQINCLPHDWRPLHYNDAKNVPLIPRKPILHYIFHPLAGREGLCVYVCVRVFGYVYKVYTAVSSLNFLAVPAPAALIDRQIFLGAQIFIFPSPSLPGRRATAPTLPRDQSTMVVIYNV